MESNQPRVSMVDNVITIGSLYSKDLPNGIIVDQYASTFNLEARFLNSTKYLLYDNPPPSQMINEYANPMVNCPVSGDELPVFLKIEPPNELKQHWKKWLPFFSEARISCDESLLESGEFKAITRHPMERLPRDIHANDPDVLYKVFSKNVIPEMGVNCPRHMTTDDYTIPCVIKVPYSSSGRGVFMAKTKVEAEKILQKINDEFPYSPPTISEVIQDLHGNYCVQFYIQKSGEIVWIGCSNQDISDELRWKGAHVIWNEQDDLKNKLYDTVMPVKEYLHKNGYFGIVGIDVLSNKEGHFVVDVNPRVNGSTGLLLIAPHMARIGLPYSARMTLNDVKCTQEELISKFDNINNKGKEMVIALTIYEQKNGITSVCMTRIVIFCKDSDSLERFIQQLRDHHV